MKRAFVSVLFTGYLFVVGGSIVSFAQTNAPAVGAATSTDEALREKRLQWFRDARFGMMIHWGLYSVPAGTWKGKQIEGLGEWIMNRAKIPVSEYELLAPKFDPEKFNAAEIVRIA